MSGTVRAYRATHDPARALEPVLPALQELADAGCAAGPEHPPECAAKVHLPVAAVRGALSSFSEIGVEPRAVRMCAGTSCHLAGGADIGREVAKQRPCHGVYCLGYCDRSPAAMTPSGGVVTQLTRATVRQVTEDREVPHPPPPDIRCVARRAVVTGRLMKPGIQLDPAPRYEALERALAMSAEAVVEAVAASGLRGRGGAAYPTGNKWKLAARAGGSPKFIVANGDEGDPGSFVDRELMERDPHAILEGMAICAHAVGASRGFVFIRAEYPVAARVVREAIESATRAGYLGERALGAGRPFVVEVVRGLGSYVCGEETALLAAIEGQRGEVWPRPPYPVEEGVFGKPTVVDNVETLADIPWIVTHGPGAYAEMGTPESRGTKALCLNYGFARPGIVEVEFGVTLREVIESLAGGGAGGRPLEAVLLGGPMGSIVTPDAWDVPVCFTAMARRGINLGHGGLVAIPAPADWDGLLRHLLEFMRHESCGKCAPCRLGSTRVRDMARAGLTASDLPAFTGVLDLMREASLCAFGRETPGPVRTILEKFGDRIVEEARA